MEREPQTQQYKQDEEAEKYPEGKGTYLSIITLNVNGLNAPNKRQRLD